MKHLLHYQNIILLLFSTAIFTSCSKESEDSNSIGKTITTTDFLIAIDENPEYGTIIGAVVGTTNEGSVSFSIIEQFPEGAFSIDISSGEMKVAKPAVFNYEVNPIITGTIKVANGTMFEIALVTINLIDLEEYRPYNGNAYLRTQEEVNVFGNAGFTHVTGNLVIGSEDYNDIVDLSPLLNLIKIENKLEIFNCSRLSIIDGMRNLKYLGSLDIYDNRALEKIGSFQNLSTVNGELYITGNPILNNVDGLSEIQEINGVFSFSDSRLTNLDAFEKLSIINGNFSLSTHLNLTNINGLSGVKIYGDEIGIYANYALTNIDALSDTTTSMSKVQIWSNPVLVNIDGLQNITFTNIISILENDSLINIDGLIKTQNVNSITIESNPSLLNLDGLNNLRSIGDLGLKILTNQRLTNLDGLSGVEQIIGNLKISFNGLLRDYCALQNSLGNGDPSNFTVRDNFYNPTLEDIRNGNCSR